MPSETAAKPRFVSYLRVSTDKQGATGLGIEAQRQAVEAYLSRQEPGAELLEEVVEVESGRRKDRPQLHRALERCELSGATLLIARMDRLSRNAYFLLSLQEAGVAFKACDNPHADKFTVGILAMVAQKEAETISRNTKAALQAAKARGVRLGNPKGAEHLKGRGNAEAARAITTKAKARASKLGAILKSLQAEGHTSLPAIAAELTRQGIVTPRGGAWHPQSVKRLLERLRVTPEAERK
jgi:DNA invertase Pin-like site-specific DNA recombinase